MKLSADFKECRDVLVALGDENRLHILYQMMITADPMGMHVGDIVKMSSLSRPAVSHHMKILKDAGVITHTHDGSTHTHVIEHSHAHVHVINEGKHGHTHSVGELEIYSGT